MSIYVLVHEIEVRNMQTISSTL